MFLYNCPDDDRYTRSKLVARRYPIARSVLCVAENVCRHYRYFTVGQLQQLLAGRTEEMSERFKTRTTSLFKTAAPYRYEPRVPATQ